MSLLEKVRPSRTKASFRLDLVSMVLIAVLSVVLVCLFDTGWLAQWLANHKGTKIDEIVFVGIGLLVAAGFFTFRRWFSLSQFVERYNGAVELSPEISRVKQAQQRDLFGVALASAVSVMLVFLFDTGSIAEWIAQHKDSKVDETIVTGIILLIGLLFFSIRRWFEYTQQVLRYEELHRKTTALNREIKLMSELGESLQSCLSVEEAHQLITTSAQVLFPGSSGAVCIIANSRDIVEVVAGWGESLPRQSYFEPKDCLALRRGRLHRFELDALGLSCSHLGKERRVGSLCVPMMAHGETMGLLYVSPCSGDETMPVPNEQATPEERLARTLAEQSALALANLSMRDALKMQSIRDPLTGLFNRRYMEESFERELRRAARKQSVVGVLMIDIDHFKKLNDSLGHEAGDIVLRSFGSLLKGHFRAEDIVCRYGGEEFAVIMPEISLELTYERAVDLCKATRQLLVQHKGQTLQSISVSIGVAILGEHGAAADTLLRAADSALYRAKQEGRDRVIIADQLILTKKPTSSLVQPAIG
jgi:diguanylate cyclase (GGDEF)-like protein